MESGWVNEHGKENRHCKSSGAVRRDEESPSDCKRLPAQCDEGTEREDVPRI